MGTSTLALVFLRSASIEHRLPSASFTLEAGQHQVGMRSLSAEARVPLRDMPCGICTDEDWSRLAGHLPGLTPALSTQVGTSALTSTIGPDMPAITGSVPVEAARSQIRRILRLLGGDEVLVTSLADHAAVMAAAATRSPSTAPPSARTGTSSCRLGCRCCRSRLWWRTGAAPFRHPRSYRRQCGGDQGV